MSDKAQLDGERALEATKLIEAIKAGQASRPEYFFVPTKTAIRLWRYEQLRSLYNSVMPKHPKRLLRKTVMRRMQARIKQGRRRIARREREVQNPRKRLDLAAKRLDLTDAVMTISPRSSWAVVMNVERKGRGEPSFDLSAL